ncbi:hypothetical protein KSP35_13525 [Aquihabitans sp. G128]|nr:hypothetical protein KSP35_13525 [Aquihabitans sp. G128]
MAGIELRYLLTLHLVAAGPSTVKELVDVVDRAGFVLAGRPSKVISDALRWEVARGRVVRLGRGSYGARRVPRSTFQRMRQRVASAAPGGSGGCR